MFGFLWGRRGVAAVPRSSAPLRVSFLKPGPGMSAASFREITRPRGSDATGGRRDSRVWALEVFLASGFSGGEGDAGVL